MEDDEDVSNMDKPSIQVDNNEDDNLQNVTNTEQCEPVHDSRFVDNSLLAGDSEPAVPKYGIADVEGAVQDEELVGCSQLAAESEPSAAPENDVSDVEEDPEEENTPDIEACESVPEVDELETIDTEEGDDDEDAVEDKAGELQKPSNDEKCEPVAELDDVNLVGESESSAARYDVDVDNMVEAKELLVIPDTDKWEVHESDDPSLVLESRLVAKDGEGEDIAVVKKEDETPEAVGQLEHSRPMREDALALKEEEDAAAKEEGTSMAVSGPSDSQLVQVSELAAIKEDNADAIGEEEEKEAQMEVSVLNDSQLVGETELSVAKEDEDEGMVAKEHEIPTEKEDEDEDMIAEEHEVPEEKEENEDEQEIPIADTELETETEVGRGGGKRKRGRNSRVSTNGPLRKTVEEDVCFICFDGGDLVLCDRRGCPKAYHPSCVNRDEAFFRAKGRWNCGLMFKRAKLAGVDWCRGMHTCPAYSFRFAR